MTLRAPASGLALAIAVLLSLASASLLHSAIVVIRPSEPIPVFGVPSIINVPVDIDGDGLLDFSFNKRSNFQLSLEPLTGGQMVVSAAGGLVTPLEPGALIGSELTLAGAAWAGESSLSACASFPTGVHCLGEFFGVDGYIGIEFPIEGEAYFGWIRFDHFAISPGGWIVEWAYETEQGQSILAGQIPEPRALVLALIGWMLVMNRRRGHQPTHRRSRATDGAALFRNASVIREACNVATRPIAPSVPVLGRWGEKLMPCAVAGICDNMTHGRRCHTERA